ncbi:MAG: acyl-CoA dehydrogenase, partial [Caulobacteraceae bacterium]
IHGGAGFTEHFPVSQYLRDCRISLIYEGTNAIQALDLVGRKLAANGGRAVMAFFSEIDAFVAANPAANSPRGEAKEILAGLADAKAALQEASLWLMQNGPADPDNVGAAASDYLQLFGLTALSWMWAKMALAASAKVAAGESDPFWSAKIVAARHYARRILPETGYRLERIEAGSSDLMALPAESFS